MITKICSTCKKEFPATLEYFYKDSGKKYGLNQKCKACKNLYTNYYKKEIMSDERKAEVKKEQIKYWAQYRSNNLETVREKRRQYYRENMERLIEARRNRTTEEIQTERTVKREYVKNNLEKYRANTAKRRSLKQGSVSNYSAEEWLKTLKYFKFKCAYCGCTENLVQDHFIPLSKGGGYIPSNIIPTCVFCNSSKHDSDFDIWYKKQKFYNKKRELKIIQYIKSLQASLVV